MIYQTLLSGTAVSNPPTTKTPLGTPSGLSVKIINQTPYELDIFRNEDQIDALPPFAWCIMPNISGLSVLLNRGVQSSVTQDYTYVSYTTIDQVVPYLTGSTYQSQSGSFGLYNYQENDLASVSIPSQTLAPNGRTSSVFSEWIPITACKKIYMLLTTTLSGANSNCTFERFLHVTTKSQLQQDGTYLDYNLMENSQDNISVGVNGTSRITSDSIWSYPELTAGWDFLRLEYLFINNSSSTSYTVSGSASDVIGVLT